MQINRFIRRCFRLSRFRFSLRTLFIAMTLIALAIVYWTHKPPALREYEKFVEDINARRYQDAYEVLSPRYQHQLSYVNFVKHYTRWGHPREPISHTSFVKDLASIHCHVDGFPDQPSTEYRWELIDGKWRLDSIDTYLWYRSRF